MTHRDIIDQARTGVFHIVFVNEGKVVASGSAFLAGRKLVTNNHVFAGPPNGQVVIRGVDSDPEDILDGCVLTRSEFSQRLLSGSDEHNHDYAILDVAMFRIDSGRIAELWVEWDNVAMLSQLGLFPPSPPAAR